MSENFYSLSVIDHNQWLVDHTIRISVKLSKSVNAAALEKAAEATQKVYKLLQLKPVIRNEEIAYVKHEADLPVVSHEEDITLCSEETNGYPWGIFYGDASITFAAAHGLSDGMGILQMLRTFMYYYAVQEGITPKESTDIYTLENPAPEYVHVVETDKMPAAQPQPDFQPNFISPAYYPNGGERWFAQLKVNADQFMEKVHELGTTPAPFIGLLAARAIRPLLNSASDPLLIPIVVNLSASLGISTMNNCYDNVVVPYSYAAMEHLSDQEQCGFFRNVISSLRNPESAANKVEELQAQYNAATRQGVTYNERSAMVKGAIETPQTLMLVPWVVSYMGKVSLPEEFYDLFTEIKLPIRNTRNPVLSETLQYGDTFVMNLSVNTNTAQPLQNLKEELAKYGIESELSELEELPVTKIDSALFERV